MKTRLNPATAFVVVSLVASVVSGFTRPLLGVSCDYDFRGHVTDGMRSLAFIRIRPVDADDPVSPAAIARTIRSMIRGEVIFLSIMSLVYAVAAIRTDEPSIRVVCVDYSRLEGGEPTIAFVDVELFEPATTIAVTFEEFLRGLTA